ncbi:hypothetical protein ACWD11_06690 [Streptomyces sp. NPDC002776]
MTAGTGIRVTEPPPHPAPRKLAGRCFRPRESAFRLILLCCLAVGIIFLGVLISYVLVEAWPRLDSRLWENFPPSAGRSAPVPSPRSSARSG